jgi:hypothetical protein
MTSLTTPSKPSVPKPAHTPAAVAAKAPLKGPTPTGLPKVVVKPQAAVPATPEAIANANAVAPAPATAAPKAAKAPKVAKVKEPKPEKVFETDEQTGMTIRNGLSYRWVCIEAMRRVWTDLASFSQEAATESCKAVYAERGGVKDVPDTTWARQCDIMRAWLRSKAIAKPFPGDTGPVSEKTPEQKAAMLERLAKGRAKKAALKGATASIDEQDEAGVVTEE